MSHQQFLIAFFQLTSITGWAVKLSKKYNNGLSVFPYGGKWDFFSIELAQIDAFSLLPVHVGSSVGENALWNNFGRLLFAKHIEDNKLFKLDKVDGALVFSGT